MPIKAVQQFMLGTVLNSEVQARDTLQKMKDAGYGGIELCSFMIHPSGPHRSAACLWPWPALWACWPC